MSERLLLQWADRRPGLLLLFGTETVSRKIWRRLRRSLRIASSVTVVRAKWAPNCRWVRVACNAQPVHLTRFLYSRCRSGRFDCCAKVSIVAVYQLEVGERPVVPCCLYIILHTENKRIYQWPVFLNIRLVLVHGRTDVFYLQHKCYTNIVCFHASFLCK